jgi:hypothetical protein
VTRQYQQTYDAAVADHLFDRGWLPSLIPRSSFAITTSNDLDHNASTGESRFRPFFRGSQHEICD